MRNKILGGLLALLVAATLNGCQLAHEELAQTKDNDKLIGVFVTYEHLDLFDIEGYLNDNLSKFSKGGSFEIDGANDKYNNRLYASLVEEEIYHVDSGAGQSIFTYVFEGLDGISMFAPTIKNPITGDTYSSSSSGAGISDTKYHSKSGDNEEGLELEGTIYMISGAMSDAIYINPVYQSDDGKVYLQSGQGFIASGDNSEGNVFTQTMTDTTSKTENKTTTLYTTSIRLSIATMNPTEKVAIYQMDAANQIIAKNEYTPDRVPEEITPEKLCEYLIVEIHKVTFNGEEQVERQIFSKGDSSIYYFVKGSKGVLYKTHSPILWGAKNYV